MNNNKDIMIAQPAWKQDLEYVAQEYAWDALYSIVGILTDKLGNFFQYVIFQYGNHLQDEIDHKKNCVRGK